MNRLSVVIANYNYERYIGAAIDSALALSWPDVEVVVVDDGSTDGSRAVIQGYAGRVKVLLSENATQRVAANRGYALTTGDVVIFLDSDDILPSDLPARLVEIWGPGVSKAQFQMQRIDEAGVPFGEPYPSYRPVPTPQDIRRWALRTSAYPTPPGSGNAYARWYLERIFPLEPSVGDTSDSACLAAAPFLGDVVSVPGVIVKYRQHDQQYTNLALDGRRLAREVANARSRWRFAQTVISSDGNIDERPLFRSRELLQLRVASRRVVRDERPLVGDNFLRILTDIGRAPFHPGPESFQKRLMISGWCLATLLAPSPLMRRLVAARYGRKRSVTATGRGAK